MKKSLLLCLLPLLAMHLLFAFGTGKDTPKAASKKNAGGSMNITLTIGEKSFSATLQDASASRAFAAKFPLTLSMDELNGNEYYNYLSSPLPQAASCPRTITAGDIRLYGSSCVVIFYKTFTTSYSYTPLGRVLQSEGLEAALKSSGGKVTFSLSQ